MQQFWNQIQSWLSSVDITVGGIHFSKLATVVLILLLTLALKTFFVTRILNFLESYTSETETELDDEFILAARKPLGWIVILVGVSIAQIVLGEDLSPQLNQTLSKFIGLAFILLIGYIIHRGAKLIGYLLGLAAEKTNTELDDLFVPYIPFLVETAVVVVIIIKLSEVFLGASAGALIGLLGGAGVAIGLLFKDIIYDWCCTVIIYSDDLFRPGQWVSVDGINGFAKVVRIGLRSTSLLVWEWGTIKKIPNSQMVNGVVGNWMQNQGDVLEWGIVGYLKIDGLSSEKTAIINKGLQEIVESMEGIDKNSILVAFKGLEGNARTFKYQGYVNDASLYFSTAEAINFEILKLLEREGIDQFQVYLVTDPKNDKEMKEEGAQLN